MREPLGPRVRLERPLRLGVRLGRARLGNLLWRQRLLQRRQPEEGERLDRVRLGRNLRRLRLGRLVLGVRRRLRQRREVLLDNLGLGRVGREVEEVRLVKVGSGRVWVDPQGLRLDRLRLLGPNRPLPLEGLERLEEEERRRLHRQRRQDPLLVRPRSGLDLQEGSGRVRLVSRQLRRVRRW